MTKHTRLPIDQLRDLLRYDPETGLFFRTKDGKQALYTLKATGYLWGHVQGKLLLSHRAAWAITHGEWVEGIDHINRVKTDNRLCNLRSVSQAVNNLNGSSWHGFKGIGFLPQKGKWIARLNGRYLGCFSNAERAAREYDAAARIAGIPVDLINFPNEP
jgi:hypothetical protein